MNCNTQNVLVLSNVPKIVVSTYLLITNENGWLDNEDLILISKNKLGTGSWIEISKLFGFNPDDFNYVIIEITPN